MTAFDFELAHKCCCNHKPDLEKDKLCGCFHCLEIFSPSEIEEWIIDDNPCDKRGTAICPHCGVDAVLGESSGFPISKAFLQAMHEHWFGGAEQIASELGRTEIKTPLGTIHFMIDGERVNAQITKVANDCTCPELGGRYKAEIVFVPDGKEHSISCCFHPTMPVKWYPESGQYLECWSYYNEEESVKLSIGITASTGYTYGENGKLLRADNTFDYDGNSHEVDGVWQNSYCLLPFTKTSHFTFGIAWILGCKDDEDKDAQTWYGADPGSMTR